MEEVYVIRIKTKPTPLSLYPSERRYSASTVGGLAMVHFGLGVLALLLGSLARSLQSPILALACLVPFVSGLLAWRRWYIDRNIGLFFYCSLFSLTIAILCLITTVFEMAAIFQGNERFSWSMEHVFSGYDLPISKNESLILEPTVTLENNRSFPTSKELRDDQDFNLSFRKLDTLDDLVAEASMLQEEKIIRDDSDNLTRTGSPDMTRVWQTEEGSIHSKLLLTTNVLVASLLETLWSLLSARIGLRGMMNRVETSYGGNAARGKKKISGHKKLPAPRPDTLNHSQKNFGSLQSLNSLQHSLNLGPSLPLPESSKEFRERVERFLDNQAAHRSIESSIH